MTEGRCSLAAEALRSWGTLKVRAHGVSMLPTLWPGDVLTVQSVRPEQVEPGEIVLYMRQDRFFIHRIVSTDLRRGQGVSGHPGRLHVRGRSAGWTEASCWERSSKFGARAQPLRRCESFHLFAGSWPGCFATGVSSDELGCDSGRTAAKVTTRSTQHSLAQHSDRTEARAISNPCHGAAQE